LFFVALDNVSSQISDFGPKGVFAVVSKFAKGIDTKPLTSDKRTLSGVLRASLFP
jgi:hypothetical protein